MGAGRRLVTGAAIGAAVLLSGAGPASAAASPEASCVGIITSNLAPEGRFDVRIFKAFGQALGAPNFGQFVSEGARQHNGSLGPCLPTVP